MEELIKTYEEYIELISNESRGLMGLAMAHGFTGGSIEDIKKGEELRKKIEELKGTLK